AAADDNEALGAGRALHDLQRDMGLVLRPLNEATGVAAIGVDLLDEGEAGARALQHALGAVAVLNVGGMDFDREQPTVGVGHDVPLASVDPLSGVVTSESPF